MALLSGLVRLDGRGVSVVVHASGHKNGSEL